MQLNFNFALNLATLIQSIFQPIDVDITSATSCNVEANFQLMNTKTDYVTVANTNKESDDFTLPGCDPIGIWHLSRHGARYTDTEEMTEYSTVLTQVRDNILSKENQWLCDADKERLKKWEPRYRPHLEMELTEKGKSQQKALGKRIQTRLPDLMSKIEHSIQVKVQATEKIRTLQSAQSYVSGFLDFLVNKPNVTFTDGEDLLLKFPDYCDRFGVYKKNESACPERADFDRLSVDWSNALKKFKLRLNTTLTAYDNEYLFELAYKNCAFEYLIDGAEVPWCKFFDDQMLGVYAYREDIDYNCKYGRRSEISSLMTCDLVNDLVQSLESFINGGLKKAHLYFGHSSTMIPFLTAMNIGNNKANFNLTNIAKENKRRDFRVFDLDPMNSNIAFVVYKAQFKEPAAARFPSYFVKIFRNERAIGIEACGHEKNCDLRRFLQYYKSFVGGCRSTSQVCQLQKQ